MGDTMACPSPGFREEERCLRVDTTKNRARQPQAGLQSPGLESRADTSPRRPGQFQLIKRIFHTSGTSQTR